MILVVFCAYLLVLLGIGAFCSRKNRTLGDFILGGRRLGPWVTAISAQASDMSGWLLIGLPGMAYAYGLSMVWTVIGCAGGTVFNWLVLAPRLRRIAGDYECLTVPDLLEAKLANGKSPGLRIVSVLIILLFYTTYIAAQFIAAGKVFETTFAQVAVPWGTVGLSYTDGLLIGGGVIIAYTMLGGFLAVSYTDLLQGLLMLVAVVVLPVVGMATLLQEGALADVLGSHSEGLFSLTRGEAGESLLFGVIVAGFAWGLGYPGQPHIISRFMAIRDVRQMRRASQIGIVWVVIALTGALLLGMVGSLHFGEALADKDQIMPLMAHEFLPPLVEGILIAAAVAAMMSTVDSQVIIAVGAIDRDLLDKLLGIRLSPKRAVLLARIVVLLLGGAGILIALSRENVFEKVLDAWGGLGAGLGPAVLLTVLWQRAHRIGITCGMVSGVLVVQFWDQISPLLPWPSLEPLVPAFLLNMAVAAALSRVFQKYH